MRQDSDGRDGEPGGLEAHFAAARARRRTPDPRLVERLVALASDEARRREQAALVRWPVAAGLAASLLLGLSLGAVAPEDLPGRILGQGAEWDVLDAAGFDPETFAAPFGEG